MSHALPPDAPAIERLLREQAWVARLARSLVADPGAADDLVQETWLAVVETPPHDVERPRAWLGTVLRRRIATWRRAAGRRSRHELGAARSEATPSTDDLAARTEVTERLARAVLALDEPYRTTVLHRFVDDAPPHEVARRMGVPVETVRTRTRRAIELLRAELDPKDPERRRRFAIAVFALRDEDQAPVGVALSSSAMLVFSALGVAAAVGLLGLAAGWWSGSPRSGELMANRPTGTSDGPELAVRPGPAPTTPAAFAASGPATATAARWSAARWSIEGTVVAEASGRGIPGAWVRLTLARRERKDVLATLYSDEAGKFATELPQLDALSRPGLATAVLYASVRVLGYTRRGMASPLVQTELRKAPHRLTVTIPLAEGFDARGRVVDERGRPVASARVAIYTDGNESIGTEDSDEEGRYEAWFPSSGAGFVTAHASQLGTGALENVTWPEGHDADLPDLVLTGTGSLAGLVRNSTGQPLSGVAIHATSRDVVSGGARAHLRVARGTDLGETRTDRSGRFELTGLRPGRWGVRAIHWPEKGAADSIETTTDALDIAPVVPGHLFRVRLVDERGAAIIGVGIDATSIDTAVSGNLTSSAEDDLPCFAATGGDRVVYAVAQAGCVPIHEVVVAGPDGAESTVTLTLKELRDGGSIALVPRFDAGLDVASGAVTLVDEISGREVPLDDGAGSERTWSPTDDPIAVPAGRYRLTFTARGPGDDETDSMFLPTTGAFAVEIGKTTKVELPCRRGGRVRFTIEGFPKGGLYIEGGDATPTSGGEAIELRQWVQATGDELSWGTGVFKIEPGYPIWPGRALDPGSYRFRVRFKGHSAVDASVAIVEGRFTDATVNVTAR